MLSIKKCFFKFKGLVIYLTDDRINYLLLSHTLNSHTDV